ncbi:MAG: hypothetical protein PHO67_03985 [Candidatus Omnitrophica bacterium]|nr:hypothetical protein [Candidatus Omnitrophota bacterium]
MNTAKLRNIKDCIKICLEKGAKNENEFISMRYSIICELKKAGLGQYEIEEIMIGWCKKNYKDLSYVEFKKQIVECIEIIFKKDAKAGCGYISENIFCVDGCKYMRTNRRKGSIKLSGEKFCTEDEIEKCLKKYAKCLHPMECARVYKIMDTRRVELGLLREEAFNMSYGDIADKLWVTDVSTANPKQVHRFVNELIDSKLLEMVTINGKNNFHSQARRYKLKTPEDIYSNKLFNLLNEH